MAHEASLKVLKKDKALAALIKAHGLPVIRERGNPFQSLVRSIIYQQVTGKAAATILARFEALFHNPSTPLRARKFPKPEEVAAMPFEKLRAAGLSGQKATYIHDLANKFIDGTVNHKHFKKMTNDEVIAHVTAVKGIGVWTAHMFLIFTLERLDILPTGDLGVQKGFQIVYGLKKLPTHEQMEKLAKPWRDHASVASWYFWRAADAAKLVPKKQLSKKKR
ncbi:MAG TPA: DNA-3-methyladenine glycosylase [Candidatus Paceibacterota bacterium]|nr:DNA-3-methyladenine glycosylase [Candidatus Paceibacterota bacterium]